MRQKTHTAALKLLRFSLMLNTLFDLPFVLYISPSLFPFHFRGRWPVLCPLLWTFVLPHLATLGTWPLELCSSMFWVKWPKFWIIGKLEIRQIDWEATKDQIVFENFTIWVARLQFGNNDTFLYLAMAASRWPASQSRSSYPLPLQSPIGNRLLVMYITWLKVVVYIYIIYIFGL